MGLSLILVWNVDFHGQIAQECTRADPRDGVGMGDVQGVQNPTFVKGRVGAPTPTTPFGSDDIFSGVFFPLVGMLPKQDSLFFRPVIDIPRFSP